MGRTLIADGGNIPWQVRTGATRVVSQGYVLRPAMDGSNWLLLLDRDAVLVDLNFDAALAPGLLVVKVTYDDDTRSQKADEKIKCIAAH